MKHVTSHKTHPGAAILALVAALTWTELASANSHDGAPTPQPDSAPTQPDSAKIADCTDLTVNAELGFLGVLSHTIQVGTNGTRFDYKEDGGQDVLAAFSRLSTDLVLAHVHRITFMWQPLSLSGRTVLKSDHIIDDVSFPQGTAVDTTYSFPFWRVSYAYDFMKRKRHEVALGVSLQLRNATIDFTSVDGTRRSSSRDIGPVPVIRFRASTQLKNSLWLGTEIDGFYAPISYLNGSSSEVTGAIVDASVRVGLKLRHDISGFINLRYLAGGGVGTSNDDDELFGDGYTKNWLQFLTLSLGFSADLL